MGTIKERGAAEAAPQGLMEERCPQPMSSPGLHVFADFVSPRRVPSSLVRRTSWPATHLGWRLSVELWGVMP